MKLKYGLWMDETWDKNRQSGTARAPGRVRTIEFSHSYPFRSYSSKDQNAIGRKNRTVVNGNYYLIILDHPIIKESL